MSRQVKFKQIAFPLILLGAILILVINYIATQKGALKGIVTTVITSTVHAPASIANMKVDKTGKTIDLTGLTLGNPPGFAQGPLLRLAAIHASAAQLSPELLILEDVQIDGGELRLFVENDRTNLTGLLSSLDSTASQSLKTSDGTPVKIIIRSVTLQNIGVTPVDSAGNPQPSAEAFIMPRITIQNIGTQTGGALLSEALERLLNNFTKAVITVADKQGALKAMDEQDLLALKISLGLARPSLSDQAKHGLQGVQKDLKDLGQALKQEIDRAGDGLKDTISP